MSGLAVGAELADDTFEVVTTEDCMPCLTGCDGPEAETCLAGEVSRASRCRLAVHAYCNYRHA